MEKIVVEQHASKKEQSKNVEIDENDTNKENESDNQSEKSALNDEDIKLLMDEEKVTEAMKVVAKNEITERMENAVESMQKEEHTDFDELD